INVGVADVLQRPPLMLAVFEIPLLMRRQRLSESLRDTLAEFRRCLQRKNPEATAASRRWVRVRTGPELRFCRHGVGSDSRSAGLCHSRTTVSGDGCAVKTALL